MVMRRGRSDYGDNDTREGEAQAAWINTLIDTIGQVRTRRALDQLTRRLWKLYTPESLSPLKPHILARRQQLAAAGEEWAGEW